MRELKHIGLREPEFRKFSHSTNLNMKLSIIAIVLFGTMMLAYTIEAKPARHFATLPRRAAGRVANFLN